MIRTQSIPAVATAAPAPAIVEQMADKMREMGLNGTAVTADSLFEHSDFTRAEIRTHGEAAADLARHRANRRLS